ncbi:MAG: corC [Rickettsiales bacterium]|jgi:Mg2+/Co2+ transporter CorB|nr:corC [Rickettsiales bacterium]
MDTILFFNIIGIFFLLMASAYFSAAETALTAASRAKMHKLRVEGNKRAKIFEKLRQEKERMIGAMLLGNNAINILSSAIATSLLIKFFGDEGVVYATIIMTFLVLIFSEALPKTYAIQHAEQVALRLSPSLAIMVKILAPITNTVQWIVTAIIRLSGVNKGHEGDFISAYDAVRGAIDLHHKEGTIRKLDKDMLGGVLDLYEVEIQDIMVHRKQMEMIDANLPVAEIVNLVINSSHTRIPLWKDNPDNIVGILHVRDVLIALKQHTGEVNTLDVMSIVTEPWFVPETTQVYVQLAAFRAKRRHFALVVDEYGTLQGLVTLEDVLEEIVGEIMDEHDTEARGIIAEGAGWHYLDGSVTIRDLNRKLDWNLPDEDASTVAGLIIHEAQTIPDVGEIFTFHGVTFEIHEKEDNQVTGIRVKKKRKSKKPDQKGT